MYILFEQRALIGIIYIYNTYILRLLSLALIISNNDHHFFSSMRFDAFSILFSTPSNHEVNIILMILRQNERNRMKNAGC